MRAVMPDVLPTFLLAPASSSKCTISTCAQVDASIRAVMPDVLLKFLSAPASSSKRAISKWPLEDASMRAVAPDKLLKFLSAPASSSKRTISTEPSKDASMSAVVPCSCRKPTQPIRKREGWPYSLSSCRFLSAPASSSKRMIKRSPKRMPSSELSSHTNPPSLCQHRFSAASVQSQRAPRQVSTRRA